MSWTSDLALRAAYHALRLLPPPWTSAIGAGLGHLYALHAHVNGHLWFKRTIANFERLADATPEQATAMAFALLRNSGRLKAEFAVIDRCRHYVRFEGLEHLERLDRNKPILIVTPHTGNWEISPAPLVLLKGIPVTALYDPPKSAAEHALARKTRFRLLAFAEGSKLVAASKNAMRQLVEAAKARENLVIYIDEERDGLIWNPPLGRKLPYGGNRMIAARLAVAYGMQVLPISVRRTKGLAFDIVVDAPIALPATGDADRDGKTLADVLAAKTESWVRAHLTQWYWLPEFRPDRPFPAAARRVQAATAGRKVAAPSP